MVGNITHHYFNSRSMFKKVKIFLLFLLILIFPSIVKASEVTRVTFTNEPTDSVSLFCTKEVVCSTSGYTAPIDDNFVFTLVLEDALAKEVVYKLFDKNGNEIYDYNGLLTTDFDEDKIATPFKTDRYGKFSLKSGETAQFVDLVKGMSYEITESYKKGYNQILPVGGTKAVGTLSEDGATVKFKNDYIPEIPGEPVNPDNPPNTPTIPTTTYIKVHKKVAFVEGYSYSVTPDFFFNIEVSGVKYSNEAFKILEADTGVLISTSSTDSDGNFSIKGDQVALFDSIPVNTDYKVTESVTDGWRSIGAKEYEGSVANSGAYLPFTNTEVSFAVSKQLSDYSRPDENFNFALLDNNGSPVVGAKYYLYSIGGGRVDDEVHETDIIGGFSLKPGQIAIFIGYEDGFTFKVKEYIAKGYVQTVPKSQDGYFKKVSSYIEVLPFVNEKVNEVGSLSVSKIIKNLTTSELSEDEEFIFKIELKDKDLYSVVPNATYKVTDGSGSKTYKTDETGYFSLKGNQTAVFTSLLKGVYRVSEVTDLLKEDFYVVGNDSYEEDLSSSPNFTFLNRYGDIPLGSVKVIKEWKGIEGSDIPVDSVEVVLYKDGVEYSRAVVGSSTNWEYTFENLPLLSDVDLSECKYTVEEKKLEGYSATYTEEKSSLYDTIITVSNYEAIDIVGKKTWIDNLSDKERQRLVKIRLMKRSNGEETQIDYRMIKASENWEYEFLGVPKPIDGEEYFILEDEISGYVPEYEGYDVYNIQKITISGSKLWEGDLEINRPEEVEVVLYQDGVEYSRTTTNKEDSWVYTFTDIPYGTKEGHIFEYTVSEKAENYITSYEEYDITNTWNLKNIKGSKVWVGDTEDDRPSSITVRLLQNGIEYRTLDVTSSSNWEFRFDDVPISDENGTPYEYFVKEETVEGYKPFYSQSTTNGLEISFNSACATESVSFDWVEIYYVLNGSVYKLGRWGGSTTSSTKLAGLTVQVPTNDFYLYWKTDSSVNGYYGFSIDSIVPAEVSGTPGTSSVLPYYTPIEISGSVYPESPHNPYTNSTNTVWHYTGSGGEGFIVTNTKVDYPKATARISKIDNDGFLPGVRLQILDEDGNIVYEWVTEEKEEVINWLQYDKTYTLHEVSALDGYWLADDLDFVISDVNGKDISFLNKRVVNIPFKVNKVDTEGNPLKGVVFSLYDAESDEKLADATSDEDGLLDFGSIECRKEYYIKEISTLEGFALLEDDIYFTVYEDGDGYEIVTGNENSSQDPVLVIDGKVIEYNQSVDKSSVKAYFEKVDDEYELYFNVENKPVLSEYNLILNKVNETGNSLSGADFSLFSDSSLSTKVGEGTSDDSGKVIFTELEYDTTYYIKETKSPVGYSLLTKPISVVLNSDDNTVTVDGTSYSDSSSGDISISEDSEGAVIVNIKVENKETFELPETGGNGILLTVVISMLGLAVVSMVLLRSSKKVVR